MKTIQKIKIGIATLAAALMLSYGTAIAQTKATVEVIKSTETGKTYIRPSLSYKLPGEIKGYSFEELYSDRTMFGKTSLTKSITDEQGLLMQAIYGTAPKTTIGAGLYSKIPSPNGTFVKVHYVPFWIDMDGKKVDKSIIGYFASINLPLDLKLSSFGELDVSKSPKWTYGEIGLEKKITDDMTISYQPALIGKGKVTPTLEHRIDLKIKLK